MREKRGVRGLISITRLFLFCFILENMFICIQNYACYISDPTTEQERESSKL